MVHYTTSYCMPKWQNNGMINASPVVEDSRVLTRMSLVQTQKVESRLRLVAPLCRVLCRFRVSVRRACWPTLYSNESLLTPDDVSRGEELSWIEDCSSGEFARCCDLLQVFTCLDLTSRRGPTVHSLARMIAVTVPLPSI